MKNGSPIHSLIEFYDDMAAQGGPFFSNAFLRASMREYPLSVLIFREENYSEDSYQKDFERNVIDALLFLI